MLRLSRATWWLVSECSSAEQAAARVLVEEVGKDGVELATQHRLASARQRPCDFFGWHPTRLAQSMRARGRNTGASAEGLSDLLVLTEVIAQHKQNAVVWIRR